MTAGSRETGRPGCDTGDCPSGCEAVQVRKVTKATVPSLEAGLGDSTQMSINTVHRDF